MHHAGAKNLYPVRRRLEGSRPWVYVIEDSIFEQDDNTGEAAVRTGRGLHRDAAPLKNGRAK
jgi:hypothetical protein